MVSQSHPALTTASLLHSCPVHGLAVPACLKVARVCWEHDVCVGVGEQRLSHCSQVARPELACWRALVAPHPGRLLPALALPCSSEAANQQLQQSRKATPHHSRQQGDTQLFSSLHACVSLQRSHKSSTQHRQERHFKRSACLSSAPACQC